MHIHAKFKDDLPNTSAVSSKIGSEQVGMIYQDCQPFGP